MGCTPLTRRITIHFLVVACFCTPVYYLLMYAWTFTFGPMFKVWEQFSLEYVYEGVFDQTWQKPTKIGAHICVLVASSVELLTL